MTTISPTESQLHVANENGEFIFVHPETNTNQVIDNKTGKTIAELIEAGGVGGSILARKTYIVIASAKGQSDFEFDHENINLVNDIITVHLGGELLHDKDEYSIVHTSGSKPIVRLKREVSIGDKVHVAVEFKTSISTGGSGLSEEDKRKLDAIDIDSKNSITINIDGTNGSDTNDGITAPFKTIRALENLVNKKNDLLTGGYKEILVKIAPGVYDERITLRSIKTALTFESTDKTVRGGRVKIKGAIFHLVESISFKHVELSSDQNDYSLIATSSGPINISNSIINGSSYGGKSGVGIVSCTSFTSDNNEYKDCATTLYLAHSFGLSRLDNFTNSPKSSLDGSVFHLEPNFTGEHSVNDNGLNVGKVNRGIVIESGENANGSFIKYADGTLICHHNLHFANFDATVPLFGIFTSPSTTWNFPHAFKEVTIPKVFFSMSYGSVYLISNIGDVASSNALSSVRMTSMQAMSAIAGAGVSLMSIGKWR